MLFGSFYRWPQAVITFFGLYFSLSASSNCDLQAVAPPGDWRGEISSPDRAKYLISMELTKSLERAQDCYDTKYKESSGQDGAGTSGIEEDMSEKKKSTAKASGEESRDTELLASEPNVVPSGIEDYEESEIDSDAGIEPILREAILAETDPYKKEVLRDRYRQLVGRDPP